MAQTMKTSSETSPLDRGWGWMVVVGAAIVSMMFGMNYRIFGLVYLELREKFHGSSTASVWVGGINLLLGGFCGPVTAWLLERYTHRTICLVGTTMSVIGMTCTGFVPNLPLTYITYGLLLGIGIALVSTASVAMVGTYFDKRKSLALALQHSASGLSALIFAPTMGYLMDEYSYSGTFMIFGGVFTNMYISCALFRPPVDNQKMSGGGRSLSKNKATNMTRTEGNNDHNIKTDTMKMVAYRGYKITASEDSTSTTDRGSNKDLCIMESVVEFPNYQPENVCKPTVENGDKIGSEDQNCRTIQYVDDIEAHNTQKQWCMKFKATFSGLQNPIYAMFFVVLLAVTANRSVTVSFLPALAIEMGATHQEASFLPAIAGTTAVISSVIMGALFDVPFIKRKRLHIYSSCTFLSGLAVLCMPLSGSFYILLIPTAINGGCSTIAYAQQMTVLSDLLGKEHAVAGLGMTRLALAFGSIIGRSISALFVDILSTNTLGFYTMSCLPMIASLSFMTIIKCSKPINVELT